MMMEKRLYVVSHGQEFITMGLKVSMGWLKKSPRENRGDYYF